MENLAVTSWASDRLDVFGWETEKALWHLVWNGVTSKGWQQHWENLGGALGSDPVVFSPSRLDIFANGTVSPMWHQSWSGQTGNGRDSLGEIFMRPPSAVS